MLWQCSDLLLFQVLFTIITVFRLVKCGESAITILWNGPQQIPSTTHPAPHTTTQSCWLSTMEPHSSPGKTAVDGIQARCGPTSILPLYAGRSATLKALNNWTTKQQSQLLKKICRVRSWSCTYSCAIVCSWQPKTKLSALSSLCRPGKHLIPRSGNFVILQSHPSEWLIQGTCCAGEDLDEFHNHRTRNFMRKIRGPEIHSLHR